MALALSITLNAAARPATAREEAPPPRPTSNLTPGLFQKVKFDQNLDAQLPLDIELRDEEGKTVKLGDYFGRRPVIVNLVYYECPMLCNEVLNSLLRSLNALSFDVGKQFDVVTVSIDPDESPLLAKRKKALYIKRYGRPGAAQGWHFLTGEQASIDRLAKVVGFNYVYDKTTDQYAHPAGIVIATPQGRLARYFFGISYPVRDLKMGVMDSATGKIGSPIDQLLLMCFHYDPRTGKYNVAIMSVIRLLGCLTVASLGTFMLVMYRRDRMKRDLAS